MKLKFLKSLSWSNNIKNYPDLMFFSTSLKETNTLSDLMKKSVLEEKTLIQQLYCRILIKENYLENTLENNADCSDYKVIEYKYLVFVREYKTATKNYFELLQISPQSSQKQIQEAYKNIIKVFHPDHRNNSAPQYILDIYDKCFFIVEKIYKVLIDPVKKQEYLNQMNSLQTHKKDKLNQTYLKGKSYIQNGLYEQSFEQFEHVFNIDPDYQDVTLYYIWAKIKSSFQTLTVAEKTQIEKSLSDLRLKYNANALYFFIRGLFAKYTEDLHLAKGYFTKATQLDPSFQMAFVEQQSISNKSSNGFFSFFKKDA